MRNRQGTDSREVTMKLTFLRAGRSGHAALHKRPSALAAACIALAASALAACQPPAPRPEERAATPARPNVLVLMAEDMSPRVGAFGDPVAVTPRLDSLAAEGVRFPNTFTTAGVCAPSRAAHITGMYQFAFGGQHMRTASHKGSPYRTVPPPEVKAYPELLRRAGYYTFTNQKLDYQFSEFGAGTGPFTVWDYEGRDPGWAGRAPGQPFFGLVNFGATHESQLFAKNVAKNRAEGQRHVARPEQVTVPPYYPDLPVVRDTIAQVYDNVHRMDGEVGEWLDRLAAEGLLEDTIVIWTTDHGDGLPRAKRELYDSGLKVPLIVRWPRNFPGAGAPGSVDGRLLSFIDLGPSVLTWAGVEVPSFMHGLPVLADPGIRRQYVHAAKDRLDEHAFRERAVRDSRYKYLFNYRPGEPGAKHIAYRDQLDMMQALWSAHAAGSLDARQAFWFGPRPQEELYDLEADPHEVANLAADPAHAAALERLRGEFRRWLGSMPDTSDEPEEAMAQRFWPGGIQPVTPPPAIRRHGEHVELACDEAGASIGYRIGDGPWRVYAAPFRAPPAATVTARAVRYGWQASAEVTHPAPP